MPEELQEHEIRDRAYSLWEQAGSPAGREDEFWDEAKRLLQREQGDSDVDSAGEESFPASDPVNRA